MQILLVVVLMGWVMAFVFTLINVSRVERLSARMPRRSPLVSIIIPARDEERAIERTLAGLRAQTYPAIEIIVIDDRSTDSTPAILERAAQEDSRITVISGEEPPEGWLGKPWALHRGSLAAGGELLLFVDADVRYEPEAVAAAVAQMEEHDVALLALFPHVEMRGFWEHVLMPNLAFFAFTVMPLWLTNRSPSPRFAIGGGTGNLVRRADYEAAGGHETLKDAVVDDVALARLMRMRGRPAMAARAEQFVSVRMYHGLGEIIAGFSKNTFAVFGRSYWKIFAVLVLSIVFHVLPYAYAIAGNVVAILIVVLAAVTRVVLFRDLGYRLDNALFAHPLMIGGWCVILVRSAWLTGVRRQLAWRGRVYDARRTRFGAD